MNVLINQATMLARQHTHKQEFQQRVDETQDRDFNDYKPQKFPTEDPRNYKAQHIALATIEHRPDEHIYESFRYRTTGGHGMYQPSQDPGHPEASATMTTSHPTDAID